MTAGPRLASAGAVRTRLHRPQNTLRASSPSWAWTRGRGGAAQVVRAPRDRQRHAVRHHERGPAGRALAYVAQPGHLAGLRGRGRRAQPPAGLPLSAVGTEAVTTAKDGELAASARTSRPGAAGAQRPHQLGFPAGVRGRGVRDAAPHRPPPRPDGTRDLGLRLVARQLFQPCADRHRGVRQPVRRASPGERRRGGAAAHRVLGPRHPGRVRTPGAAGHGRARLRPALALRRASRRPCRGGPLGGGPARGEPGRAGGLRRVARGDHRLSPLGPAQRHQRRRVRADHRRHDRLADDGRRPGGTRGREPLRIRAGRGRARHRRVQGVPGPVALPPVRRSPGDAGALALRRETRAARPGPGDAAEGERPGGELPTWDRPPSRCTRGPTRCCGTSTPS